MSAKETTLEVIGCLSITFPDFVAKELASLADEAASVVQGFTDPISALADLQLETLISDAAQLSEGDILSETGALAAAGAGVFAANYYEKEITSMLGSWSSEGADWTVAGLGAAADLSGVDTGVFRPDNTFSNARADSRTGNYADGNRRIKQVGKMKDMLVRQGHLAITSVYTMPFFSAQAMCQTIIEAAELKTANLNCLRKHLFQLSNTIGVLIKNSKNNKDKTFENLKKVSELLAKANDKLTKSQFIVAGSLSFDATSFDQAQKLLVQAAAAINPPKSSTSILGVVTNAMPLVDLGGVYSDSSNWALANVSVPWLIQIIESEVKAIEAQIKLINYTLDALTKLIQGYWAVSGSSKVKEMRALAIEDLKRRISAMKSEIDAKVASKSNSVSEYILIWSARLKSMISVMQYLRKMSEGEGSAADVGDYAVLLAQFDNMLAALTGISTFDGMTQAGVEDVTEFSRSVRGLCAGAKRVIKELDGNKLSESTLATFHASVANVITQGASTIDSSLSVASRQKSICEQYVSDTSGVIKGKEVFDSLIKTAQDLNQDRAVDWLHSGKYQEFLDADINALSYLGATIDCLTKTALNITDDQTRRKVVKIRDSMLAEQKGRELGMLDSFDKRRVRIVSKINSKISTIEKNAKTIESIVAEFERIYEELEENAAEARDQYKLLKERYNAFDPSWDKLQTLAGGALVNARKKYTERLVSDVHEC